MTRITRDPNERDNYDFVIKEGSVYPSLEVTLTDNNNEPIDLTDSSVKFRMKKPDDESLIIDKDASIGSAPNGEVVYFWDNEDTDDPGAYNAEVAVDYDGYKSNTFNVDEYFPTSQYITIYIQKTL